MDRWTIQPGQKVNGPYDTDDEGNRTRGSHHFNGEVVDTIQGSKGTLVILKDDDSLGVTIQHVGHLIDQYDEGHADETPDQAPADETPGAVGLSEQNAGV